jgi:N-acetylmuramoyl-L-alanine amidase
MSHILKLVILQLLFYLPVASQYTLPLYFPDNLSKNTVLGSFTHNGIVYISLTDLLNVLNLTSFVNADAKKIEIKTAEFRIKITADNSYAVIVDKMNSASVVQLYSKCYFAANSFFVPAKRFIPILDKFISEEINFDYDKKSITVKEIKRVSPYDIASISYEEKINGTLVQLHSKKKLLDYDSWVKYDASDKEKKSGWLYVTIANVRAHTEALQKVKPLGIVKQLLIFPSPTSVQLTFKLSGPISGTEIIQAEGSNDMLITIHTITDQQVAEKKQKSYERNLERERNRWKMDVVVIDPGHGGKDPGAIGVTKTKEKDVTLSVALKLGRMIEKNLPDVKVVYTRRTDEFVELYKRGQIANQANGKLFVSLHCNAAPRKPHPANGFEVYLLRPGKTEHALKIAERENAVIQFEEGYEKRYQELTEENFILLAMAQSAYMKYSEQFADILTRKISNHTELENQGVKQAGFFVLVGASMPNVLVELGYLSNRRDEKFLKSSSGRQQLAELLFKAVKHYKEEYDKTLEEGKTFGTTN